MWFKQIQLYQLKKPLTYNPQQLAEQLSALSFHPCLPSLPNSSGWVAPVDKEGAPLVHGANGHMMICLQIEEKILPATVVRQQVDEKVKVLEAEYERRIRNKEKQQLKDDIIQTLLPRAFSKLTRIYAYFDIPNQWLVVNAVSHSKIEPLLSALKKTTGIELSGFELKKPMPIMTQWLLHDTCPKSLSIEKNGVLQDPNQENRVIRCKQQSLHAESICGLLKDGCQVKQLAFTWHEHISFNLHDDFTLRGIRFNDTVLAEAEDIESESPEQKFDADFIIMVETLKALIQELLGYFLVEGSATLPAAAHETA